MKASDQKETNLTQLVHVRLSEPTMKQILKKALRERRTVSQTLRLAIDDTFLPKAKTAK